MVLTGDMMIDAEEELERSSIIAVVYPAEELDQDGGKIAGKVVSVLMAKEAVNVTGISLREELRLERHLFLAFATQIRRR
jgi:hypothetical protein